MTDTPFTLDWIEATIERSIALGGFEERLTDDGPFWPLTHIADADRSAGFVRLWAAPAGSRLDRMIHVRLQSDPVETQLFFIFGRRNSAMPHFHSQAVQFSPDGCVYNADLIPRLDAVEHPDYFREVFHPLSKPYWRATKDRANVCANAPANPMIAVYLSPWSIGTGGPAERAEFERVRPQLDAYLEHYLALADNLAYPDPDGLARRDEKHLEIFFSDRLDPRAWKGVYGLIGEDAGARLKQILSTCIN